MELLDSARKYLQEHSGNYDTVPGHIGINSEDYNASIDYQISGSFPEEDYDHIGEARDWVGVDRSSDLQKEIKTVFNYIRSNISVGPAEIVSLNVSSTVSRRNSIESSYTVDEADARAVLEVKHSLSQELKQELLDLISDKIREFDAEFSKDELKNVEFLFANRDYNELAAVRGYTITSRPQNYYSSVESFDEVIEKSDKINDLDSDKLQEQDEYEVLFLLDDNLIKSISDPLENIMNQFINSTLETHWNSRVKAERIVIGDFDHWKTTDMMKYYVSIPIVGNTIGVIQN